MAYWESCDSPSHSRPHALEHLFDGQSRLFHRLEQFLSIEAVDAGTVASGFAGVVHTPPGCQRARSSAPDRFRRACETDARKDCFGRHRGSANSPGCAPQSFASAPDRHPECAAALSAPMEFQHRSGSGNSCQRLECYGRCNRPDDGVLAKPLAKQTDGIFHLVLRDVLRFDYLETQRVETRAIALASLTGLLSGADT